jgi:hypothetical protein
MRRLTLAAIGLILAYLAVIGLTGQAYAQAAPTAPPTAPPTTPAVVRVSFADVAALQSLVQQFDVWAVDRRSQTADLYVDAAEYAHLLALGYRPTVDALQTATLIQPGLSAAQSSPSTSGIPGFACYRTVEETYDRLDELATLHPTLARVVYAGDSWRRVTAGDDFGYRIPVLVLTNHKIPGPKPVFFLMAAIHARELATAETALRFAEQLLTHYGKDADATWLLDYTEIHVLPQANPDGRKKAEEGLSWRKNVNDAGPNACVYGPNYGIDLNRNSSFKWGACDSGYCSSTDPCDLTYRGVGPASEPETQALEETMRQIFADRRGPADGDAVPVDASGLMISLHSYGQLVLFPWGWTNSPTPNGAALRTLGEKFSFFTGYRVCQPGECLYSTDGTTDDWAYGELGVAAFTFEIGTEFFQKCKAEYEFETDFDDVLPPVLDALLYAAKSAPRPYTAPGGPDVLDPAVQPMTVTAGAPFTLTVELDSTRFADGDFYRPDSVPQKIRGARFTVDGPSWLTATMSVTATPGITMAAVVTQTAAMTLTAVDGAFDSTKERAYAVIDTSGWEPGRHLLLVEAQNEARVWGVPTGVFVCVAGREQDDGGECVGEPAAPPLIYLPIIRR